MKPTRSALLLLFVLTMALPAIAQETYFGKNKVQYRGFDWYFIQTRHFDLYFYDNAYPTAKFAAAVMESSYVEISKELNYYLQKRVPVFIYNSHGDFQQTNIISELLPEGVGGFTEAFKNRIVIPFTGSYEDFRHVLHHELTHAVVYDLLYGNSLGSFLSSRRLFNLPLWFAEGFAEYSSRYGWDYQADMFVRDATINNYLAPPEYLGGFLAYKQGQAMLNFIADKYGEEKLGEILQKGKIHLTMSKTLKSVLGITEKELFDEFSKEMKRRYWPEIAARKEAGELGLALTKAPEDGSYFNEQPVFSPDGDKIAMFTDARDYTEIVMISAVDGKKLERLVKAERSGDLESLHSFVSGVSFSPDGKQLAFVAKSNGKDVICLLRVKDQDIIRKRKFDYYSILSPAWSPDSTKIAFSALEGHKRDLFVWDLITDEIRQVTDDRFDDLDPSWLANSSGLVFSSDRPHSIEPSLTYLGQPAAAPHVKQVGEFEYGHYDLFRVELSSLRVTPIDVGPGANTEPSVSPDGTKIAFLSNRNGIDNLYIAYLDSVKYYAVTDILTGVWSHSWSPDGQKLAFQAFGKGAFNVFVLKNLIPVGENGVLKPTDFVLGKYNRAVDGGSVAATTDTSAPLATTNAVVQTPGASDSSTVAADSAATPGDSAVLAQAPDTTASTDSVEVATTGVVDDEFVRINPPPAVDPLDSLMKDIRSDTTGPPRRRMPEPAAFDSVPGVLPSGEYQISKYRVKFTPDFMGGGFSYDTFFGVRGQSYFVFSDYLGNHQIYVVTDIVNTIDQSNLAAFYFNNTRRTNLGGGFFHTKNFYLDSFDHLFSDRFYGAQWFLSRPQSTFKRFELSGGQYFIDRKYYDFDDPREDRSSKVTTLDLAYVTDNVLWGYTGPINGSRTKFTLGGGMNLFDKDDIEFYSAGFDWRKYWHFGRSFSFALRFSGAASYGKTPKQYFLGGTTNWIGTRDLEAKVYDVENLYFSEVITPLRGYDYYGLSGDRYGLINAEFRFPMVQVLAMRFPLPIVITNVAGALFADMGSAWFGSNFKGGHSAGGSDRFEDIKTGFGFGMRANLFNFVLLRYDLAWTTDFLNVSDHPTYYFSMGADF